MSCMIDGLSTMKAHAPTTSSEAKEPATPKSSAKTLDHSIIGPIERPYFSNIDACQLEVKASEKM